MDYMCPRCDYEWCGSEMEEECPMCYCQFDNRTDAQIKEDLGCEKYHEMVDEGKKI